VMYRFQLTIGAGSAKPRGGTCAKEVVPSEK
jgi:hypothetical protein